MSRRIWALAFAIVMIASTLAVLAPVSHANPAAAAPVGSASSGVRSDVTTISAFPVDGYGYYSTDFSAGPGPYDQMYFEIYDASADHFVNLTLIDLNATRDGVGSPAFHVEVPINQTTGYYYSWQTGVHYTFPFVAIGGYWNISASAPLGGYDNFTVFVYAFNVELNSNVGYGVTVLPGESITLFYSAYSAANDALYTQLTNLSLYGQYYGAGTLQAPVWSSGYFDMLTPTDFGQLTFTVPDNATPNTPLNFTLAGSVWSHGVVAETEYSDYYFYVGVPRIQYVELSQTANVCGGYNNVNLNQGLTTFGCARIGASFTNGEDFTPIGGLTANIHYWNGTKWVTPAGTPTTQGTSNATGYVPFEFVPMSPPFIMTYWGGTSGNLVNITVSDSAANNTGGVWNWTTGYNATFYLYGNDAEADVSVVLGQATYLPGQTVTATWTIGSSDPSLTGTVTAEAWWLDSAATGLGISQGVITSTASTGALSIPLPAGWVGSFYLYVDATNATDYFYGYAEGYVTPPTIAVNPNPTIYLPGTTVSVAVSANQLPSGGNLEYEVYAIFPSNLGESQNEGAVASGTVANGSSFSIVVPSADTPSYYDIYVWMTSSAGTVLSTTETEIDEEAGYGLAIGIQTQSKYSDGSFQPGETVTFTYAITSYGSAQLPSVFEYYVYLDDTPVEIQLQGASPTGTFQLTIPSNQPAGTVEASMELYGHGLNGPNCGTFDCYAWVILTVNPSPSTLNMYVGGTSGVTVGWLILLVVVIVIALILAMMIMRRKRSSPPSGGMSTTTPMSAPAPAPSGTAPAEWKEPAANQPPMPTPPPGST